MSLLTVGRANPITGTVNFNAQGDRLRISGLIAESDVALAKAIRQQILGYDGNFDETVFPVTNDVDLTVDGFYNMLSGSVDVGRGNLKIGHLPFTLDLLRVSGYALPLIESTMLGALRTNGSSIGSGTEITWHALPAAATSVSEGGTPATRVSADGNVLFYYDAGGTFHNSRPQFQVVPASYYTGAAKLEVGSPLRTVVGQQIPNQPANWRLSNGLLRVTPNVGATNLRLDLSCYDGSQWETVQNFQFIDQSVSLTVDVLGVPTSVTPLRNAPEEVAIRIAFDNTNLVLDLALRRGSRMVYGYLARPSVLPAVKLGIRPTTAVLSTALTGGLRATGDNPAGNRFVLTSSNTISKDLTNGIVYLTTQATEFSFAAGFEVGGSGAAAPERAQDLIYQYMAADTETMIVVRR